MRFAIFNLRFAIADNSEIANLQSQIENLLISSVRQHLLDAFLIAFADENIDIEDTFPLLRLFRQNVPRMRMSAFEFAARRRAKTLCGALMCF